jgi:hypothetical protein
METRYIAFRPVLVRTPGFDLERRRRERRFRGRFGGRCVLLLRLKGGLLAGVVRREGEGEVILRFEPPSAFTKRVRASYAPSTQEESYVVPILHDCC